MAIIEKIGEAAMYEQLAEECSELAQAALKAARYIRDENPCGIDPKDIDAMLTEEFTDVFICCAELDMRVDMDIWKFKMKRFECRWDEANANK